MSSDIKIPVRLNWTPGERRAVLIVLVIASAFGILTLRRTAWRWEPMTDLPVFLRAGQAIREGTSPYQVSFRECHYLYPPLFAILISPLGEKPLPEAPAGAGAYRGLHWDNAKLTFSVAFWYILSFVLLVIAVHRLAQALEVNITWPSDESIERRRWWQWRLIPVLICLPAILITLGHGQVELVLLFFLVQAMAALIRGKDFRAGLWLALPICIKVIPAALLLYPLWRGRWRCLLGCATGLFIGLIAIPVVVLGPTKTMAYYQEFVDVVLKPGTGTGTDRSRAKEVMDMNATDNASMLNVLFNLSHRDSMAHRERRQADMTTRLTALGIVGVMVLITLLAAGWKVKDSPETLAIIFGLMSLEMLVGNTLCHRHYFVLLMPLVMGIVAADRFGLRTTTFGITALIGMICSTILIGICSLPAIRDWADFWGIALWGVLLLWVIGLIALIKFRPTTSPAV